MGDAPHSMVLQSLAMALGIRAKAWKIRVLPGLSIGVGGGRWFTADICVVSKEQSLEGALKAPPLLCVEIVSPEDGAAAMQEKIQDYLEAGVKVVWEIYPSRRKVYQIVNGTNRTTDTQLTVPGTDIVIFPDEIFDELQDLETDRARSVLNNGYLQAERSDRDSTTAECVQLRMSQQRPVGDKPNLRALA